MKHTSVRLNSPIEFIESNQISPFVSKVQIKVCYVGDEPNRNHSIITKDVARKMAPSLRGCPIVGFYNENNGDFEEHNRRIDIANGEWRLTDTTVPYGFVDLNAKLWFATYLDDNETEHEYLCTEGYVWDHAYPEAKRIVEKGNNHSMELDEGTLDASWSKDKNGRPEFFIINEALLSKLCILGEESEPCFEGSQITAFSLVVDESFQNKLFAMINELKDLIKEGGTKVFNTYAVEIGDALWSALWAYVADHYPVEDAEDGCCHCSRFAIEGIYEENAQKFVILRERDGSKYYRLDFSLTEEGGIEAGEELVEVTKTFVPSAEPQFAAEDIAAYEAKYLESKAENIEEPDNSDESNQNNNEDSIEEPEAVNYVLEEIPEYVDLTARFAAATQKIDELTASINQYAAEAEAAAAELETLRLFKKDVEKKEKQAMINRFYMLSNEDKKDVIDNIDNYSLEDIEAKLSVICVRNKVSFAMEDEEEESNKDDTTFNLDTAADEDNSTPAWVQAAIEVANKMNN